MNRFFYFWMNIIRNKKILSSWMWVVFCSIAIFLSIPVARTIQTFVAKNLGKNAFVYFVLSVLALAIMSILYFLIFRLKIYSVSNYIWLLVLSGIYVHFTLRLVKTPAEATHFLEYGLLGFFLFRALTNHIKDKSIYFTATLFALIIGTFDETFQWITPGRLWSFRDVGLNTLSGGLFQVALWKVIKPKIISEKIRVKSMRIFTSIFGVCLIVLGLCASNIPRRVEYYTKLMPWLSFLQKEEPMSEFGYKYEDQEIGVFYSRLNPENLLKTDNMKGEEYAQILNKSSNMKYRQFLKHNNPISNPFLHELRIHTYRRDKYFKEARKTANKDKKRDFFFIAYKENLILKKYFTQTIKNSVYWWEDDKTNKIEALIDKDIHYESPVSANLFTAFSEKAIWAFILVLISLLALFNFIFVFIERRHKAINL